MQQVRTKEKSRLPASVRLRELGRKLYQQRQLFLILAIPMAFYILFEYAPMLKIPWAFSNYGEVPASQVEFIGLENFKRLMKSTSFLNAFRNTIIISLQKLLIGFPIPILIALFLNEIRTKWYKKTVQTIIYFPHFLSWVVIGSVWFLILAPQNSINAQVAEVFGVNPVYWFASKQYIRGLLVLTDVWASAGYSAIVYLAAVTGIDMELYEAAIMDGAGKFRQIWHISLPGIRSTIVVMLIFQLGKILNIFDQVLVMASPVVYETADVIQTYAFRTGISDMRIGYSMAISVFKAVISFILVLITNRVAKLLGEEGVF